MIFKSSRLSLLALPTGFRENRRSLFLQTSISLISGIFWLSSSLPNLLLKSRRVYSLGRLTYVKSNDYRQLEDSEISVSSGYDGPKVTEDSEH